ncbi:GNAT family N-acetyltransferase [Cellulomonas rhizosphaerae]|uniref:N-acetyltransferase n=1 Tax=Cellulomonas rhizosphaerae TaxID=2293719 RepID=A0A413RRB9_9CELL|nr:GNAT family protein [Cellulomonas rhizosphaerae]RHA44451.1 N-acetyltransferase [Cellulomonas rhizosphaerae]
MTTQPAASATRLLTEDDAEPLTALLRANRDFLAPWDPHREDAFFTVPEQAAIARRALDAYAAGTLLPWVVVATDGSIVGRLNLAGITRGPFQSAGMGYWVARAANGRGLATAAVGEAVATAFGALGLHRVQAETLPHNVASRRVLAKNGFREYGLAPRYLNIGGRWQDHVMFQRLADDSP